VKGYTASREEKVIDHKRSRWRVGKGGVSTPEKERKSLRPQLADQKDGNAPERAEKNNKFLERGQGTSKASIIQKKKGCNSVSGVNYFSRGKGISGTLERTSSKNKASEGTDTKNRGVLGQELYRGGRMQLTR